MLATSIQTAMLVTRIQTLILVTCIQTLLLATLHCCAGAGIDLDDMTNPYQAAAASALAFCLGAGLPLLAAAFIEDVKWRILSIVSAMMPLTASLPAPCSSSALCRLLAAFL